MVYGLSDNTNFTFLLTTICDVASIMDRVPGTFGMEPWDESIEDCFSLFTGKKLAMQSYPRWEKEGLRDEEHPLEPYNLTEQSLVRSFMTKKMTRQVRYRHLRRKEPLNLRAD